MNRTAKALTVAALLSVGTATLAGFALKNSGGAIETTASTEITQAAGAYEVDKVHSNILFKIRHGGLAYFYGHFDSFSGTIDIDPENIEDAKFSITVRTSSVDTGNRTRDGHIKDADFFNARQYTEAIFTSTGVKMTSDGVYELAGDFAFHGETNPVTATLTDVTFGEQQGKDAMGFHAVFSIKRSEFNMMKYVNPSDPESGALGDNVDIIVSMEAVID